MSMNDLRFGISLLLVVCLYLTGITGLIQSRLDLHRFVYHRYLAYGTLALGTLHLAFHARLLYRYWKRR